MKVLYELTGPVVHGRGKGAAAGFPTANLALMEGELLPPAGVYATRAELSCGVFTGVTNVGTRPTADSREDVTVETWLPGFSGNLYGEQIRLHFLHWLRGISRFPDMAALKRQIDLDAQEAERWAGRFPDGIGFFTFSAEETRGLSQRLAPLLPKGSVVVLRGEMGTGKSEFSRGLARGMGITGPVPSPTFTILNEYDEGSLPFYHFDWYRVTDEEELLEIGAPDYLPGRGVTAVEWAERAESLLPSKRLEVFLQPIGENARLILFSALGGAENPALRLKEDFSC